MNINCTDQCYYQKDGKCTLNEVSEFPTFTQGLQSQAANANCAYFVQQIWT